MIKNILYFTRTMSLGGTEKVVLQLCRIMKNRFDNIIVCSCGGVNTEELEKMGIKHYYIPDIDKKNLKTVMNVLKVVQNIIKEENINIIHTHHRMAAFYTKILKLRNKFTFINTSHNTFNDKKLLTRFSLRDANIIAVGNKVKNNLCQFYGISENKVNVIYNGIEPFQGQLEIIDIFKMYKDNGYFLIGNIGRLSEQKGMEYFIKAVPLVLKVFSDVKFFIVGDGEDRLKVENLISELNLINDVVLLGYRNDVQNLMGQLDLIVLSSLWEGLPLTPIEAFSMSKTVVATAVDGTVEVIDNNINGILIDARDSNQIADKIIELYKSPEKVKELEKNAIKKYKEKFSYEVLEKNYIDYYNKILE